MQFDLPRSKISFPFLFEASRNPQTDLPNLIQKWQREHDKTHNILLLSGSNGNSEKFLRTYLKILKNNIKHQSRFEYAKVKDGSIEEVINLDSRCAESETNLIFAIGGGKVIDVAKMLATRRNTALFIVPSALSSDCIASPISVLQNADGKTVSLPSGVPSAIFIDLGLTSQAPQELTKSGIGDIISNASALLDLALFEEHLGDQQVNGFAKLLSRAALDVIRNLNADQLTTADGHENIATGLVLSGFAMSFAGNSLPCSGAEHLISHAIDASLERGARHGYQVAIATIFCNELRKLLKLPTIEPNILKLIEKFRLPNNPQSIGITRDEFLRAVSLAPSTRPGRFTVLSIQVDDDIKNAAFENAYGRHVRDTQYTAS